MTKLEVKTSEDKDHAEYSASGSSRWLNCPGSHERAKRYPPLPESKYAAEGTTAHACLEFLLKNRANLKAAIVLASKTYSAEMLSYALEAVEYALQRQRELPESEILCETRVDASPFLKIPDQFGTLDISIVQDFGVLEVIDYKYGAGIGVDPREYDDKLNSQLAYYALALSYQYHHNFAEVILTVIQPRAFHESGETIRSTTASMDELLSWSDTFYYGRIGTVSVNAPLKSGKWCKFCPASLDCPELKENSFRDAQIVFSDDKGITHLPVPSVLPNLGTILSACDKLEEWISKVRAHALDVLERGGEVQGWKLVEKRGTRKWLSEEQAATEARKVYGPDAFTEPELKSPAQIEKTFGKAAVDWVKARVSSKSSGNTLAPANDKRPAVTSTKVEDVFSRIDEEQLGLGMYFP